MSAHTPGPWTFVVESGGNFAICDSQGNALQCDEKYYPWVSKNIADWHLIAAAPELLDALRLCFENSVCITDGTIAAARAAITKATGERS